MQQQLGFQPTVSKVGPLRRPVVQTAIGLFGVLCIASAVQWVRNKPLAPAPVVAAVVQVAASAAQATQELVQRFSEAPARPERAPGVPTAPVRLATTKTSRPAPTPLVIETLATRPVSLALESSDSLAKPAASASPAASPAPAPAGAASPRSTTVRGYISDAQGRPLVGATVLVKGSSYQGTSTDATGHYELTAPVGAMLQYGYAGYTEHLQNASVGTVNVTLQPSASSGRSRFGRQQREGRLYTAFSPQTAGTGQDLPVCSRAGRGA